MQPWWSRGRIPSPRRSNTRYSKAPRRHPVNLTCEKTFAVTVPDEQLFEEMRACQHTVHEWGEAHRVTFDSAKEELKVIHPRYGQGEAFRYLAASVDTRLNAACEINRTLFQN